MPSILALLEAQFSPLLGASVFQEPKPVVKPAPPLKEPEPEPKKKGKQAKPKTPTKAPEPVPEPELEPAPPAPEAPLDEYELRCRSIREKVRRPFRSHCSQHGRAGWREYPAPSPSPPPLQYGSDAAASRDLEGYLLERQATAAESFARELARKDAVFTRNWRQTGLPTAPSHLQLDASTVTDAGLINPKTIMGAVLSERLREVCQPPAVSEYSDSAAAPHYLASTQTVDDRACTRKDTIEAGRQRCADSDNLTWKSLPAAEIGVLIKKSEQRRRRNGQKMTGVKG